MGSRNRIKIRFAFCMIIISISLFISACDNSGNDNKDTDQQTTVMDGKKTTVTKTITPAGGSLTFPDGATLIIPKNGLSETTDISITKDDENTIFILKPEGLKTNSDMTLQVPVTDKMVSDPGKIIVAYIYSNESPLRDSGSEKIKSEKLLTTFSGSHVVGDNLDVEFNHFSLIRFSIQDILYLPLIIPSNYLKPADIIFALSAENPVTKEEGFDWFPGHTGMLDLTDGCNDSNACDMIESIPDFVKYSNLYDDFVYIDSHVYMGARRPKDFSLSDEERTDIVSWAENQLGKPWQMLNDYDDESQTYNRFSCVGLVEAAYNSIEKPVVGDNWLTMDSILRPLDMYEKTKPINEIDIMVGESLEGVRVNPVFLDQEKDWYLHYRNLENTPTGFSFIATNLPEGASFDSDTGIFQWENIPESYENHSHTVTFNLSNTYPRIIYGTKTVTISETLTINVHSVPDLGVPQNVVVTMQDDIASISWNEVPYSYYYRIYQDSSPGVGADNYSKLYESMTNSFELMLTPGQISYFVITAVNDFGESPVSSEVFAYISIGTISGHVTISNNEGPLRGATVRLDIPGSSIEVMTDINGYYSITIPSLGDYFLLSVGKSGYVPQTANIRKNEVSLPGLLIKNFELDVAQGNVLILEIVPEVHHLGDDNFTGTANSQFQQVSEGIVFEKEFITHANQLPPNYSRAEIHITAKGVETKNEVYINNVFMDFLDRSPSDGSFGLSILPIDISNLSNGQNTLKIVSIDDGRTFDDFEFANVLIYLYQ